MDPRLPAGRQVAGSLGGLDAVEVERRINETESCGKISLGE